MDSTEEDISQKEMLGKIAELDYNQSQLRELNAEMRLWLDAADDEIVALRSENDTLRKQVKELEKIITAAQQDEAELSGSLLDGDLSENRCRDKVIQDLEKESSAVKEENKKLTAKLKNLEEESDEDKLTLSKLRAAFQSLEMEMEGAQMALQHRNETINQKNLQLKHLEETVEEYSDIIKDLRMTKLELSKQLEERQDEASLAVLTEAMREEEGSVSPQLSLAEEIQLLVSSGEIKPITPDSTDVIPVDDEENEAEELLESHDLTADLKAKSGERCARSLKTSIYTVLCIITLSVLVFVALGCCAGNLFSIRTLQSSAMLHPYIRVHYNGLPPI